ncbi:MAG: SwmB domain-containing protein [Prochlorococcus sp.]
MTTITDPGIYDWDDDRWSGTSGDDVLIHYSGSDIVDGRDGTDILSINANISSAQTSVNSAGVVNVDFTRDYSDYYVTAINIESIAFNDGDLDTLASTDSVDSITYDPGEYEWDDDRWTGTSGDDVLIHYSGSDIVDGKDGYDILSINTNISEARVSVNSAGIGHVNFTRDYSDYRVSLSNIEKIAFNDDDYVIFERQANVNDGIANFSISGTPGVGQALTAAKSADDPDGNGSFTYDWESSTDGTSWAAIGTGEQLTVAAAQEGQQIRLQVNYTDAQGFSEAINTAAVSVPKVTAEPEPTPEPTPNSSSLPTISDLYVKGNELIISYNRSLGEGLTPAPELFTIKEDGRIINTSSIDVNSLIGQVKITLESSVEIDSSVTLSYRDLEGDQASGVIEDADGNEMASVNRLNVDNQSVRAQTPLSVLFSEVDGSELILAFNRELKSNQPSKGVFRVKANGKSVKVESMRLDPENREATLTLKRPILYGEDVSITYIDADGDQRNNVIEDIDGNDLETFVDTTVTNNTIKAAELEIMDAEVTGDIITLQISEELGSATPSKQRFKIISGGRKQRIRNIDTIPEDGIVNLYMKKQLDSGKDLLLNYKDMNGDQKRNVIEDFAGNDLPTTNNFQVTNFSEDNLPPLLIDAYIDGTELALEFDKVLAAGSVSASRIKLMANGKRIRVNKGMILEDEAEALFTLKKQIPVNANSVTVSYRDPRGDQSGNKVIEDQFGNDLNSFSKAPVEILSSSPQDSSESPGNTVLSQLLEDKESARHLWETSGKDNIVDYYIDDSGEYWDHVTTPSGSTNYIDDMLNNVALATGLKFEASSFDNSELIFGAVSSEDEAGLFTEEWGYIVDFESSNSIFDETDKSTITYRTGMALGLQLLPKKHQQYTLSDTAMSHGWEGDFNGFTQSDLSAMNNIWESFI